MAHANRLLIEVVEAARGLVNSKNPFVMAAGRVCFYCGGSPFPRHLDDCPWYRLNRLVNEHDQEEEE